MEKFDTSSKKDDVLGVSVEVAEEKLTLEEDRVMDNLITNEIEKTTETINDLKVAIENMPEGDIVNMKPEKQKIFFGKYSTLTKVLITTGIIGLVIAGRELIPPGHAKILLDWVNNETSMQPQEKAVAIKAGIPVLAMIVSFLGVSGSNVYKGWKEKNS